MIFLEIILLVAAAIAISIAKESTSKGRIISIIVAIVCSIAFIICIVSGWTDDSGSSKWDDLSDKEKEWYEENYGDGQYDKYKDAINDYKNK